MSETHVVSALKAKRAEVSGYIRDLELKAKKARENLAHIDATLKLFAPTMNPETIPPKHRITRSRYLPPGVFGRLVHDEIRKAAGAPVTAQQVATAIIRLRHLPDDDAYLATSLQRKATDFLRRQYKAGHIGRMGGKTCGAWVMLADKQDD